MRFSLLKAIARDALRKGGFEITRISTPVRDPEIDEYLRGEIAPFSRKYIKVKRLFIHKILTNPALLNLFRTSNRLPDRFGYAFDERCVEYPWLVSRLELGSETLLDAGSTLNYDFVLELSLFQDKKLYILTLAPERDCFWDKGISYVYEDLRDIPVRNNYYDTIVCISTLEHIGLNNTMFIHSELYDEQRPDSFLAAIKEMKRILKPGGKIFITVPYGKYHNFGTIQTFDADLIKRLLSPYFCAHRSGFYS